MRKYIIGAIFGALLTFTTSTYAADIKSLIGEAVQGSFPLLIDGVKADKDAIVVNNISYIPVRSAGQLFGYDISFIDSQVVLKKTNNVTMKSAVVTTTMTNEQLARDEQAKQTNIKYQDISKLQGQMNIKKNLLVFSQNAIDDLNKRISLESDKSQLDSLNITLQSNKDNFAKLQLEVNDLQSQIDTINATIPVPIP